MFDAVVVYLPIGRKTFDLKTGEDYRKKSQSLLEGNCRQVYAPEAVLTSVDEMEVFINKIQKNKVDIVIYQSVTFADAEFIEKATEILPQPVIVWSVREPSVGGRLRLNSLTGGNSTCHTLKVHGRSYRFLFGNPDEKLLQNRLSTYLKTEDVVNQLASLTIGVVGEHPPGFYFSGTDETALKETIGVNIHHMDLFSAFKKCVELPKEEWLPAIERAEQQVIGLNRSDETVEKFAQFTTYIKKYIKQHGINALAVRCWPDFFNELGAAACSTLSQFTEDGVVSACESDIHGSISMYILQELGGGAPYLGDLVHLNEENNSVTFWHCGAGAYSLANPKTGARPGVHPNRTLGFTMEFGLKSGIVTIARLSKVSEGYRLFIMKGEALDTPQQFAGTSVEVKLESDAMETLYGLMDEGLEPHYALVYADVADQLVDVSKRLGIDTIQYF
jgi:L-fucose isomerase-like protein